MIRPPPVTMESILRLVGRNIKAARIERRWALEELAVKTRISLSVLRRIEDGQANPTIDTVFCIARALDVQPAQLFRSWRRRAH